MVPAFVVIAIGVDPSRTLVLSQVVLSFGIPFALIPLVIFTARRDVMGPARQPPHHHGRRHRPSPTLIVALNIFLLLQTFARSSGGALERNACRNQFVPLATFGRETCSTRTKETTNWPHCCSFCC